MTVYTAGFQSATPATAAAYATLNSATRRAKILGLDVSLHTAVQSDIILGIPANEATPPVVSTSITPTGSDLDIAATARIGTAWSTNPTAPSVAEKEITLAAVIGAAWSWLWPPKTEPELKIGGWRVLWNPSGSTAGQLFVSIMYEE